MVEGWVLDLAPGRALNAGRGPVPANGRNGSQWLYLPVGIFRLVPSVDGFGLFGRYLRAVGRREDYLTV